MNTNNSLELEIHSIKFTGDGVTDSTVNFDQRIKIITGASNTGKSFLVECIDYMLGKEKIDKITQSKPYSEISLQISLFSKPFTLFRGFPSNTVEIYSGHLTEKITGFFMDNYKVKNPKKNEKILNDFFINQWPINSIELAKNMSAEKCNMSLRLLSRVFISYEEKIIDKRSPIDAGGFETTPNKNLFKYLLTGTDDSSFKTLIKKETFDGQKAGKSELLEELISNLNESLDNNNHSILELKEQQSKLESKLAEGKEKLNNAQSSVSKLLIEKNKTSKVLSFEKDKMNNLTSNASNFEYLSGIYNSDIQRLESQEEAAFLLSVNHKGVCSTCGNKASSICNDLEYIDRLKNASLAEIKKINTKKSELKVAINSTLKQKETLMGSITIREKELRSIESNILTKTPILKKEDKDFSSLMEEQTKISNDIKTLEMIESMQQRLQLNKAQAAPKKFNTQEFYPEEDAISKFCKIYSNILTDIRYPGNKIVTFDFKKYDVVIDGNPRHLNGKGVRAILHSVFKIATLVYCISNKSFHPKVIVLDSPLVTFRDPTVSKYGELSDDEKELAKTKLSYYFFSYLEKISSLAQFIIIENIDIPDVQSDSVSVETFHGSSSNGRKGLF